MKLIAGSSNQTFSNELASSLSIELLSVELNTFANGEKRVLIDKPEKVKGENIILVQSFSHPVDEHILETLLMIDALERIGARHVNLVIPWLGYSLQDKVFRPGEPISAKVIANLVSHSYVKRIFLLDLHNSSTPGFFSVPTEHLSAQNLFAEYVNSKFAGKDLVVASPDFGGLKRARVFADLLKLDLVNIDKQRDLVSGDVIASDLSGQDVTGIHVLVFDDCIVGGSTVVAAAELLKKRGAAEVHFLATHGIFAGEALEKIGSAPVDSVVITNSINHNNLPQNIITISASDIFRDVLKTWM